MQKNVEKMSINYSPNFNLKKRPKSKVKYIVFHYTGMKSERGAIRKLTSKNSNVSCHYFIKTNGQIIRMIPDLYVAWHAGISSWKKDRLINSNSIGIEISNSGHQHGYKNFSNYQVKAIIRLSKFLIKKYKIKKNNVLGHSDIAPLRKKDPGEKFPWKILYKKKICIWHNLTQTHCKKLRNVRISDTRDFYSLLFKFGYEFAEKSSDKTKIYKNFQRRFRPQLISSIVDKESYAILKSLIYLS